MMVFDIDEVYKVIKILRGNSNCNHNCSYLTKDLVEYFRTGIIPENPSSISDVSDIQVSVLIDNIKPKKEESILINNIKHKKEKPYWGITKSIIDRGSTSINNLPCNTTFNDIIDLDDNKIYDVDNYTQKSVHVSEINYYLIQ